MYLLSIICSEPLLSEATVLVFANKQDLPNAFSISELTERLGLYQMKNRAWYVQGCTATNGDGLYEGLDWMSRKLKSQNSM